MPEPSREDRYEAAVRAVLNLCDEAAEEASVWPRVPVDDLRAAIRAELAEAPVRRERIEHVPGYGIRVEEVDE
jgi:hypothetical protein